MKYLVFVDSNAIIGNGYHIKGKGLTDFFKRNKLVIADVTVEEVIRKFLEIQQEKEESVKNAIKDAEKFGVSIEVKTECKIDYTKEFYQELSELNAEILDRKRADIEFLFKKSMSLAKPFKINKKSKEVGGFRDVLIWNLWLIYLKENHENYDQVLIINQDNDFIENGKLHEDLLRDLNEINIPDSKIKILSNIKELVELAIDFMNYDNAHDEISDEDLQEMINKIVYNIPELEETINDKVLTHFPEEYEAEVSLIERMHRIYIDSISGSKDDLYIYFTEKFEVTVTYFLPKNDYILEQKRNVEILDSDWNEWVMLVDEVFELEIGFEATLNMFFKEIKEAYFFIDDELKEIRESSYYDIQYE